MILSAATVCLVPEAKAGPFVFHGDLAGACKECADLGFDAVELFAASGDQVDPSQLRTLLKAQDLRLAAVGTGAGMLLHGHTLCAPGTVARERARDFAKRVIDFGARFAAPAIIGSMQGKAERTQSKETALERLTGSLRELAEYAADRGQKLLFEPLNRYETDLVRTLSEGILLLDSVGCDNLYLLADLFHMNIEEASPERSILDAAGRIGHVHFVDSNRHAAGFGHTALRPIADALISAGYSGYASAEAFPLPDSSAAARKTIESFRQFFPR